MKIGIYIDIPLPKAGGEYTLLETIKQEISSSTFEHELLIFYRDPLKQKKYISNKITYINLSHYLKEIPFWFRIKRKIYHIFFKKTISLITIDNVFHDEGIDFLWLLGPYNIDTTIPFAFTVWDLGHRMLPAFPEVSGVNWYHREPIYQKMLTQATFVITGNETGKHEILMNYSINPDKIHILPFSIPFFCYENNTNNTISTTLLLNKPFVFYPAQFWAHKNHVTLIEAIAWLRDEKKVIVHCYFTGYDYGNLAYLHKTIKKCNLDNQIFILGFISREELICLYKNALAMVFPSLMGPNNLPLVESLALGCPVLYSNLPGHIEQLEDNGLSFNPLDPIEIGESILKLYYDDDFRKSLISKGFDFSKKYRSYSYFDKMKAIIDIFSNYHKTWNENLSS